MMTNCGGLPLILATEDEGHWQLGRRHSGGQTNDHLDDANASSTTLSKRPLSR